MNESPKQKTHRWWRKTAWIWLVFFALTAVILCIVGVTTQMPKHPPYPLMVFLISSYIATIASVLYLLFWGVGLFLRWSFASRHHFRRVLIGLAVLATLSAFFYLEEDWRGKRAWASCQRELQAKVIELDWNKYIPPPVPDDQNFFTVNTNFYLRFVKLQTDEQMKAWKQLPWLNLGYYSNAVDLAEAQPLLARLTIVSPAGTASALATNALNISLNTPTARRQIQERIQTIAGRSASGCQGFPISEFSLAQVVPAQICIQAETPPSLGDLQNLIPADLFTNIGRLGVEATADPKTFEVKFVAGSIVAAADYLQWSDQFVPAFDDVRAALKRPYANIPGDYSLPFQHPIPNFVILRNLAQTFASRAQCYLLLGQPEKALPELTLVHDLCRILEKPPTGQPMTLVEAMINVAITGLYVSTIQEGFRLHAWQEPQLAALQAQLKNINLPPYVADALKMEMVAGTYLIEKVPADKIADMVNYGWSPSAKKPITFWTRLGNPMYLFLKFSPRGWIYQNMATVAGLESMNLDVFDLGKGTVSPRFSSEANRQTEKVLQHRTLFNFWAAICVPNFAKADQTLAFNQTLANQAQIACALERYHLAHGSYPETLAALEPAFIEKLPPDLIGGQPLHYRRTDDGQFVLYSVGWNETDDGGLPGTLADVKKGDWVWPYPAK